MSTNDEQLIEEIRQRGYPNSATSNSSFEISTRQGSSLAALLLRGSYRWNNDNGTRGIDSSGYPVFKLGSSTRVITLSPSAPRLESLWPDPEKVDMT